MKMIRHLTAGEKLDAMSLFFFNQNLSTPPAIAGIFEDTQPAVAAIHDVVGSPKDSRTLIPAHAAACFKFLAERSPLKWLRRSALGRNALSKVRKICDVRDSSPFQFLE
ncbi:MAG: hypothetical protein ABI039_04495 [Vicinamibacterales bacterium]